MTKRLFNKIRKIINSANKKIVFIIFLINNLVSISGLFLSCSLLNSTRKEMIAHYVSNVVEKSTNGGEYLSILVESKEDDNDVRNPYNEFLYLYGAFRESLINYAGTVNADKKHTISIDGINSNLSFLYSHTFSSVEYNEHWKHEYYPIELMFNRKVSDNGAFSFCYLSETQAKTILELQKQEPTAANMELLLGQKIDIIIDGTPFSYSIENIYFETNYYYNGLKEIMGDFVFAYYKIPPVLKRQASYFLRQYDFQNLYYLNRINSIYSEKAFSIKVNHHNIKNNLNVDDELILSYFHSSNDLSIKNILSCVSIGSFIALIIIGFIFLYISQLRMKWFHYLLTILATTFPFLLFFFVSTIFQKIIFFSSASTIIFSIILFFELIYLLLFKVGQTKI